ncbi:hypothetical protein MP228_009639 [Amoeboaphelidium protococcarum]|nr:hypothetical protein MP228_009639 [Amoeboaphelidium protococcarum]
MKINLILTALSVIVGSAVALDGCNPGSIGYANDKAYTCPVQIFQGSTVAQGISIKVENNNGQQLVQCKCGDGSDCIPCDPSKTSSPNNNGNIANVGNNQGVNIDSSSNDASSSSFAPVVALAAVGSTMILMA